MRDYRLRRAALGCLSFACALLMVVPAHAVTEKQEGLVRLPWVGPSGEDLNAAVGPGTFGFSFPMRLGWPGKPFSLTYDKSGDVLVDANGLKMYTVDLDVYFYNAQDDWRDEDGTIRHWNTAEGVEPGPESGTIPAGTDSAFVVISSATAHDVSFEFRVTV